METMWSVEVKANSWDDDLFNGTYEECIEWCNNHKYVIGNDCRLAKILVDEDGCMVECLEIVKEI